MYFNVRVRNSVEYSVHDAGGDSDGGDTGIDRGGRYFASITETLEVRPNCQSNLVISRK